MEKILERIGLYDLWVTFFPGVITLIGFMFNIGFLYSLKENNLDLSNIFPYYPKDLSMWFIFIIFAIFIGIILQEFGRVIRKLAKLTNASECLLDSKLGVFTKNEIKTLNLHNYGDDSKSTFHIMNTKAQEYGVSARYVKLSILQNMSLSLATSMLFWNLESIVLLVVSFIYRRFYGIVFTSLTIVLSVLLMFMFLKRSERFNRYWVRNIVFAVTSLPDINNRENREDYGKQKKDS